MSDESVVPMLRRNVNDKEYRRVRRLWMEHSSAEDQHNIPGLMATLTEDCLYELANDGTSWHGKEGATRFYTELLTAFPDIHFDLLNIVIGPQGVYEEAHVTGTHEADWLGYAASGKPVDFDVVIFFPWDPEAGKFSGERMYIFNYEHLLG